MQCVRSQPTSKKDDTDNFGEPLAELFELDIHSEGLQCRVV
jgi:hypothetical protein